jgi:SulP family sulfate permease
MLLAMALGTVLCFLIGGEEKGVILVDNISVSLPPPISIPFFSWETFSKIASDAFAVALLGLIEAVAIARSIATKTNQRIDGNQEFIGQGLSNIVGSFFSCYAGSGSFTRSGVNYQAGGRTPLSAIFASIFLALVLLLISPVMSYLPMAVMGGIILLVAYNLIDFAHIKEIIQLSKTETAILFVTFLSTLFIELEFAIYIGVILSLITYLQKTSKPKIVEIAPDPNNPRHSFFNAEKTELPTCPQLKVIRIDGALFFGAVQHVAGELHQLSADSQDTLLIVGDGMNFIDMSGADLLVQEVKRWRKAGGDIYFCNLKNQVSSFLERGDFLETIREDHIFTTKREAITAIYDRLDQGICAKCRARIFEECKRESL